LLFSQSCSPRDRGFGVETTGDRNVAFFVLVLALEVLVLVLVLKHWSRLLSKHIDFISSVCKVFAKCNAEYCECWYSLVHVLRL